MAARGGAAAGQGRDEEAGGQCAGSRAMRRRGVADPCVLLLVADDLRDIGTRLLRAFEGAQHRCAGRASPNDTHAYHGARRFRRSYKEFSFGASLRCYETKARRTWHIALGPTDIPHTRRPRARPPRPGERGRVTVWDGDRSKISLSQTRYTPFAATHKIVGSLQFTKSPRGPTLRFYEKGVDEIPRTPCARTQRKD